MKKDHADDPEEGNRAVARNNADMELASKQLKEAIRTLTRLCQRNSKCCEMHLESAQGLGGTVLVALAVIAEDLVSSEPPRTQVMFENVPGVACPDPNCPVHGPNRRDKAREN